MRYTVEVTDEFTPVIELGPGAPALHDVELSFEAGSEDELREMIAVLGFDALAMKPTEHLHARRWIPVLRDGEQVARATVYLWLGEGLRERRDAPPIAVLARIRSEAEAAKRALVAAADDQPRAEVG